MMTPKTRYQQDCQAGLITADPSQLIIIEHFEKIWQCLQKRSKRKWYQRLLQFFKFRRAPSIQGIYLWGSVGIGKTYLMDLFFDVLPTERKRRLHFHRFMQQVHSDLKRMQGVADPLKVIARDFSMHTDVLCFDEFVVNDIADAMLLGGLLDALFEWGIILVATSNIAPAGLYHEGLQRKRFLPAIALLERHTTILHLASQTDYRLRTLEKAGVYYTPLDEQASQAMHDCFVQLSHPHYVLNSEIEINQRRISVLGVASEVVWFDFNVICQVPRSQQDYLEIARLYHTVFVSNVPQLQVSQTDRVTYLIHLIDVLYDHRVKLIVSAAVTIDTLYPTGNKQFEFKRTQSRLYEMGLQAYLAQSHISP